MIISTCLNLYLLFPGPFMLCGPDELKLTELEPGHCLVLFTMFKNFFLLFVYFLVPVNQSGGMGWVHMGPLATCFTLLHFISHLSALKISITSLCLGLPCRTALLRISVDRQRALALGAPLWLGSSIFLRCFERPASEPQSSGELSPVLRFIGKPSSTRDWCIPYQSVHCVAI